MVQQQNSCPWPQESLPVTSVTHRVPSDEEEESDLTSRCNLCSGTGKTQLLREMLDGGCGEGGGGSGGHGGGGDDGRGCGGHGGTSGMRAEVIWNNLFDVLRHLCG